MRRRPKISTHGRARLFYPHPQMGLEINKSVHEAKNPNPKVLKGNARAFWDSMEDQAWEVYGVHAEEHDIPEKTAWKAVRMHWEKKNGQWVRKRVGDYRLPQILLDPGDTVHLGKLLDYAWITPDGYLIKREFDVSPDLWWNQDTKTLYAFPGLETPEHCLLISEDLEDEAKMFERWSQREAKCAREMAVPVMRTYPRGAADSVSYRSDKWHEENPDPQLEGSGEFIHLHGDGVWIWEDCEDEECEPTVIMIRGGDLDVEERGIIH